MEYQWVHSSAYSSIPPNAVPGGNDVDGDMMYVGRAFHHGDMLVVKVIPSKHIGYVSWRGQEIPKEHFEILCGQSLVWRHCYDHVIPENTIICGNTALAQPVYVGRGHYEGSLTVGRVSSVHRALLIPFGGVERRLESYELLVNEKRDSGWSLPSPLTEKPYAPPLTATPYPPSVEEKPYPPPMIEKPYSYLAVDAKPYPYPPMDAKPYSPFDNPPAYTPMPQPLPIGPPSHFESAPPYCAPPSYGPPPSLRPPPPPPYNPCPPVVVPPTQPRPYDMWVNANSSYTPTNGVHAGHEPDMSAILVCRSFHNGDLIPGKAVPNRGCAYVSFAGQEVLKSNFEVLVGEGYHWVPAHSGIVPPGAVEAGRTAGGETLFVGRAHYCGSLTPGKVQRSHECLYIAFGGCERRITNYEVLVRRNDYYQEQAMKMHY